MVRACAAGVFCALLTSCAHPRNFAVKPPASGVQSAEDRQIVNAIDAGDGDFELKRLRERLDAAPGDLNLRLEIAGRYLRLGLPEIAIEHCRLACERAPESDEAHIALARTLRDTGRAGEGALVLARYTESHPNAGFKVWAWLGLLRDASGDWKAGETAHRKALALAPDRDDLHNNLGFCLLRQGRKKEAADEFTAALALDAHSEFARNNLAAAMARPSKEALSNLESVTDAATAHSNMAAMLIESGDYAGARKEIDAALGYNRQHSAALTNLALVSRLDGKPAEIVLPARAEGRWIRARKTWKRLWGGEAPKDRNTTQAGASVASR
jgi:Flp pilus assembly protein TadD